MHQPYEIICGHPCDFRVKYRLYPFNEGGRQRPPSQEIRWDFWYEHDNHTMKGIFIISPEFEDKSGNLILGNDVSVSTEGTARMWILNRQLREYHRERILVGTKGYFLEGNRVADCDVIEVVGLHTNPIT